MVQKIGLLRCGKSCRLRWINYLRPDVKRGNFTKEEEDTIITLHKSIGNKWSRIAAHLPGRTDNEIKNVWNTYLKKRLLPSPPNDDASSSAVSPSPSPSPSLSPSSSSCSAPFADSAAKADASSVIGPAVVEQLVPPPRQSQGSSLKQEQLTSSGSSNLYQEPYSDRHFNQPDREETLLGIPWPGMENVMEEVDKPERGMENDEIEMEVPLEFDHDFWELLDNLEAIPRRVEGAEVRTTNSEGEAWGGDIVGGEEGNWLRRLERELGQEVSAEDCGFPWELLY